MLKALIVMELRQISSRRKLAQFLRRDAYWMRKCGFEKAPAHNTFSKFIKRLGEDTFHAIFRELVAKLKKLQPNMGSVISIDSTLLWAFAKGPNKFDPEKKTSDKDARWVFNPAQTTKKVKEPKWFFGYKVQVATDAQLEIPLGYFVTPANRYDSTTYQEVLARLRQSNVKFNYILADAGYDSISNIASTVTEYQAIPIIARNRRASIKPGNTRNPQRILMENYIDSALKIEHVTWSQLYYMRSASERVFSRLKEELCLKQLKVRGLWRVSVHVCLNLIAMLVVWIAATLLGFHSSSNKISEFRF